MKQIFRFLFLMSVGLLSSQLAAQTPAALKYTQGKFFVNDIRTNSEEFLIALKSVNPEAHKIALNAKKKLAVSNILGVAGGVMVGFSISGETGLIVAATGVSFLCVSVPLMSRSNRDFEKAVDVYNIEIKKSTLAFKTNGLNAGLVLSF